MKIEFPDQMKYKIASPEVLAFEVFVDGQPIWCEISGTALLQHFGAQSTSESDMLRAFRNGRARIEATTRRRLEESADQRVFLLGADF